MTTTIAYCVNGDGRIASARSRKGYCADCAKAARAAWRDMVADSAAARDDRAAAHAELYARAYAAGRAAGEACNPAPMIVDQHADVLDDASPITQSWYVPSGVCGFAWVNIRPGSSSFARWLTAQGYARRSYYGGIDIWISDYSQSYDRKIAHAQAMARVLQDAGITAHATGRLD
jgi:hypothetical protein